MDSEISYGFRKNVTDTTRKYYALPAIGELIVFNEFCEYHTRSGRDAWPLRGICEVIGYNNKLVQIKLFKNNGYQMISSCIINDFRMGIIRYEVLDRNILSKVEEFTYNDLDMKNLHPYIQRYLTHCKDATKQKDKSKEATA